MNWSKNRLKLNNVDVIVFGSNKSYECTTRFKKHLMLKEIQVNELENGKDGCSHWKFILKLLTLTTSNVRKQFYFIFQAKRGKIYAKP